MECIGVLTRINYFWECQGHQEDRIPGEEFHVEQSLGVQITVITVTYLYLIVPIRARILEGQAS